MLDPLYHLVCRPIDDLGVWFPGLNFEQLFVRNVLDDQTVIDSTDEI